MCYTVLCDWLKSAGRQDGMEKAVTIRKVKMGDENSLAYIQTESRKEAFRDIVPEEKLLECTQIERVTGMYRKLLEEQKETGIKGTEAG